MGEISYRSDLPVRPARIERLPLDERGYPVPWFVSWDNGKPDFRIVRPSGVALAHNRKTCWLCGEPLGRYGAFVIGPMCGVNRTSSEPPSHLDCADYAARACPFLTRPLAVRNERGLEHTKEPGGVMIKRNPGVAMVWVTREWRVYRVENGVLFKIGDPSEVRFYREGRAAKREEIDQSVSGGLPFLMEPAQAESAAAEKALGQYVQRFTQILDRFAPTFGEGTASQCAALKEQDS